MVSLNLYVCLRGKKSTDWEYTLKKYNTHTHTHTDWEYILKKHNTHTHTHTHACTHKSPSSPPEKNSLILNLG